MSVSHMQCKNEQERSMECITQLREEIKKTQTLVDKVEKTQKKAKKDLLWSFKDWAWL